MKKFIAAYRDFIDSREFDKNYRLCYIYTDTNGNGFYTTIELFKEEIELINTNNLQIIII